MSRGMEAKCKNITAQSALRKNENGLAPCKKVLSFSYKIFVITNLYVKLPRAKFQG